jgi:hypothetical protein
MQHVVIEDDEPDCVPVRCCCGERRMVMRAKIGAMPADGDVRFHGVRRDGGRRHNALGSGDGINSSIGAVRRAVADVECLGEPCTAEALHAVALVPALERVRFEEERCDQDGTMVDQYLFGATRVCGNNGPPVEPVNPGRVANAVRPLVLMDVEKVFGAKLITHDGYTHNRETGSPVRSYRLATIQPGIRNRKIDP